MHLTEILKGIEYKSIGPSADPEIKHIADDSRSVTTGDMFVAFKGYDADGYTFINEAVAKGAGVIVAEKDFNAPNSVVKVVIKDVRSALAAMADNFYGHPSQKLKVLGVTGTNGKTTITYIIENILRKAGEEPGVIGTISYRLRGKMVPAKNTTPGSLELQSMLYEMVKSSAHYAVMEVSSHALDQLRVGRVSFDVAIFTNITPEHLDYHKTMKEYFNAKAKIFANLKVGGCAILNNDDDKVASLKGSIKNKIVTYGIKERSDVSAKNVRLSLDGSKFDVVMPKGSFNVSTGLIGRHNVSNILAAVAACGALGMDFDTIKAGVEGMVPVPGRLEPVECGHGFKVFVDFAHTEDALDKILSLLREVSRDKIITVFGCGGNRDRAKRPLMGKVACRLSDHVIVTSDNPRFEEPYKIIDEIVNGIKGIYSNYEVEVDRQKAIEKALNLARAGSIVVIAGKGHEDYQIIKDKVLPFSDREVVRQIIRKVKV